MEITTIETTYNTIPYSVASKLTKSNTKASKTITPKYDIGEWVYIVTRDFRVGKTGYFVMPTKIEWYKVYCIGKSPERHIGYRAKIYGATKLAYDENKVCDIIMSIEDDYDTSVFDGEDFEKNRLVLRDDSDSTLAILYTADHVTVKSECEGYFDMEGYAVAKVAQENNIPVRLFKSVTDILTQVSKMINISAILKLLLNC